ncbi:MAG: hypothetical protein COU08_04730 [Candidatus Harrisonbacteria bacterium CG10_big_fil_rev_8_21_14_0_10_42_17]|uniref:SHSP domain-containing protein n=1 Tax=Candidatus Harrisonbacteria bacterium CG10_big_fil_rev_8_21_14_0_10_42_17 TaxID=1974584 RepID=A0A2M6WH07_9BACT|nr:MAG: hypothetical protein COU08_04730 [Candidatus Harrisonbacteria bacterium CG10_big_fil_rev_8_21_14_0_10_42_17]
MEPPYSIPIENNDPQPGEIELVKTKPTTEEEWSGEGEGQLTIDVYQTPENIIIESPIAGVNPDELDVAITSESVTIKGRRERDRRIRDEDYFYQECYWGRFSRSVILPQEIDADQADASIKNGVLIITLPKITRSKSKKIKVRFG